MSRLEAIAAEIGGTVVKATSGSRTLRSVFGDAGSLLQEFGYKIVDGSTAAFDAGAFAKVKSLFSDITGDKPLRLLLRKVHGNTGKYQFFIADDDDDGELHAVAFGDPMPSKVALNPETLRACRAAYIATIKNLYKFSRIGK